MTAVGGEHVEAQRSAGLPSWLNVWVLREYGVVVAEVNLKLIQDLVSSTKVGERGVAYVVDVQDRVIAHPDLSLIRRKVSALPHVKAARAAGFGPLSAVDSQYSRAHPRISGTPGRR